jgi:hypothetical protein
MVQIVVFCQHIAHILECFEPPARAPPGGLGLIDDLAQYCAFGLHGPGGTSRREPMALQQI